jgi:exopolyphosphatase/guanosine-5'-triphosphate,3'-diphosphate pyrophosphatase
MNTIIPRWEWRTFGDRFGAAEDAFAALEPTGVQESDETYFLAPRANVKMRFDLIDIKLLREVDEDGLERWEPVLKAQFPISAADARATLEAMGVTVPALARETYPLDAFIRELAAPAGIRAVEVHKRRVRYLVNGCTSEVSDVTVDGKTTRTIAIESTDKAAVVKAVRDVGLGGYLNTSYPIGLAALVDGRAPRFAVIDVGTNSVKFHVAERLPDGGWRRVVDRAEVTRLGEGLPERGTIAPEPMARTAAAIKAMVEEAKADAVTAIAAVGTAGMRIATNRDDVVDAIRREAGITVEVIPGDEEARLAYLAVQAALGLGDAPIVVFDTGGGSSQFTFGQGGRVDERFSVDVGAVRYTEAFGLTRAVGSDVVEAAAAAIGRDLARLDGRPRPTALVGMGGAVTNITAVKHAMATYDPDRVQGTVLDRAELDRQIELYRTRDADGRREVVGLQPKRAEVILAGALVVRTVMDKLGQDRLTVSDRGLRHGVLIERFGGVGAPAPVASAPGTAASASASA